MEPWIIVLFRALAAFIVTFILVRLMGKKSLARVTPFRAVSYIVIAVIAGLISTNMIPNLVFGYIALLLWALLPIAFEFLELKSKWFYELVNGKETVLIKHGKIMEESLMQTRLTGEALLRELRTKNAFNMADVEFAVLEPTGDINVYLKSDKKPVTAHDLGIKVAPQAEPQTVILDGNILNEPLSSLGLNKEWIGIQLENMGVSIDNVFIGQVDSSGDLYLDLFDDAIVLPQPKVKEMLYANLEKSQASLSTYALETKNEEARKMYRNNAQKLELLMEKLKPYLLK